MQLGMCSLWTWPASRSCLWTFLHRRASWTTLLSACREHKLQSEKGTLRKIFAASSGHWILEPQRGSQAANTYLIYFSQDASPSSVYLVTKAWCTFLLPKIQKRNKQSSLVLPTFLQHASVLNRVFPNFRFPQALHAFVLLEQTQMSFRSAQKAAPIHIPIQLHGGMHPGCICAVSRNEQWQTVVLHKCVPSTPTLTTPQKCWGAETHPVSPGALWYHWLE